MTILRRALLLLLVIPALVLGGAWFWLLHTQHGASWVWSQAVSASGESLKVERLSGSLSGGLVLSALTFSNDSVDASITETTVAIDIDLISRTVTIDPASADGSVVELKQSDDASTPAPLSDLLRGLRLPVELIFPEVTFTRVSVRNASESEPFLIDSVTLSGRWKDDIQLDRLDVQSPLAEASGDAQVLLADPQSLRAGFELTARPELEGEPISIRSNIGLRSDFQSLNVNAEAAISGTAIRATLESEVDLRSKDLAGYLEWENFRWPLSNTAAQFTSQSGSVTLAGSLDAWTIDGTLHVLVPDVPEGRFTISAEGDRDSVAAEIIDGDILGGTVAGSAEYSWLGARPFAANVVASGIRTESLVREWPLALSGSITVAGQQQPLSVSVDFSDVRGSALGRPLAADGHFGYSEADWSFENLRIQHGDSIVLVNGNPYTAAGASFEVSVDALEHYIAEASGTFEATGNVSVAGRVPRLQLEGTGENIAYGSISMSQVLVTDLSPVGGNVNLELAAIDLMLGGTSVDDATLQLYVDAQRQAASLGAARADMQTSLSIEGSLDDWTEPSSWTGQLSSLELSSPDYAIALDAPADLHVSQTRAGIDEFIIVSDQEVRLAGTASWTQAEGAVVSARLATMPLNLINTYVETGLTFDQYVTGQLDLQIDPDGRPTGRGDIAMTPGSVVGTEDPDVAFSTDAAKIGFDLDVDGLRAGIIDIPLPGQGQIAAEFDITGVGADRSGDINAVIDVDLADIGMLVTLFPLIDDATGSLFVDLEVGGSVDNPSMRGDFALRHGALIYLPIGLVLSDIEVNSELREDGEIELAGSFRAGDGLGQIRTRTGRAQRAANGLELTLSGDNLLLIDVPDLRAVANTDLQIAFDGQALNIDGDLMIPSARIRPNNLGTSKVYESDDVVIVAGELPEEPDSFDDSAAIQVFGNLRTSLGDDVVVDLDIAQTDIGGAVDLTWSGDLVPMADGRLIVDGAIQAFGQRLDITEGQIRFPRGPVNDPYLRVRAEREIFGNTEVRRAGLLVTGSIRHPTVEAYTNPVTTEERAMTLLVTGSDFNYEQGVGSVDFGTYIAPRVFVSYGIGLFDTENVIRVRYDLKKGFGITGTSGERDSGFDLSYQFEN